MKTKKLTKKIISIIVTIALIMSYLPTMLTAAAAAGDTYNRVADPSTMDGWKNYFDLSNLDTSNAGGVWTDKSVFTDASAFPNSVTMIDDGKNFLTALSAIAANKEVVGYSTVPTDTVFVLDLSQSMTTSDVRDLVDSTNAAMKKLLATNNNNRVGVVLYSGETSYDNSVSRLLPIDRYTTTRSDGNFIQFSSNRVSVYSGVSGTSSFGSTSRTVGGGTYIQAGLWEAWKMFSEVPDDDIYIGNDNWQSGEYRMPIVVLMTDGAPTRGTNSFANVGNSNVGNGYPYGIREGDAFLVQLTASYVKNSIENKYKVKESYGAGRSLFYTLGFNIAASQNPNTANDNNIAYSVVNPEGTTLNDAYWNSYNNNNSVQVTVTSTRGSMTTSSAQVTVTKNSYATSKNYVYEYFSASGTGLSDAFNDIVEEIVLQSRYYPTHLEGGSPDFSGYVTFTDTLGEYMEVKHINGILLGNTLFDGHMMASKIADNSADGLGTPEAPTALGDEFIRAVKSRLGIADTADVRALVAKAYNDHQLYYEDENNWSNYIAWYAKADGAYAGFYDENGTEPVPADAVYINRSYGFLGETTGSIKNSDMMYMSVQVHTNIETGKQTVIWKIPAALVPMITYLVELEGNNINNATNVALSVENANSIAPIRLIYETGLRSDLNEFNITRVQGYSINDATNMTCERHIAADGHTRLFWNNSYDITGDDHTKHKVTLAEFTPNKENERFYYTFDSAVYKAVGASYELVGENETLSDNGTYYHRRYVFTDESTTPIFRFEKMSVASIKAARDHGWQANFTTIDNRQVGAWAVPMGTPARELQMYSAEKADDGAATQSAHMVFYPYLSEQNNTYYVDMNLGNNGLLAVTPATGLKISKTVDLFEPGTSDTFKFRITAQTSGTFNSWITAIDATPSGEAAPVTLRNGVCEFEMKKDQTFWLSGLSAGTAYTVEEISENDDYKVKSVHVNGISTGKTATGTVAEYLVDDVQFVNTVIGEGDLVITKQVVDASGNTVDINDNIKFNLEVTLTAANGAPVSGTFEATGGRITIPANGKFTITLAEGESFVVRGIPEETRYTIVETNIPAGFSLNTNDSELSGVVDAATNDQALIVNNYAPTSVTGGPIAVEIIKTISGNRTNWLSGETYSFTVSRSDSARATGSVIRNEYISDTTANHKVNFTLANETFTEAGTYYFTIRELEGNQGGITYDTTARSFAVVVADDGMDGDLDIISVANQLGTAVSGQYLITANFNNVYAPTGSASAVINIEKLITGHSKSGYQFALYSANPAVGEADEIIRSGLTAADGKARITLNFSAADVGNTYTYYLAEIGRGELIHNIQYSDAVYKIDVAVKDNFDGTVSADIKIDGADYTGSFVAFTNVYVPSTSDFVTISGQKKIIGDRALNVNEFEFIISAVTNGAPMPAVTAVKNDANGFFAFPDIEFADSHKGQTFVYEVRENNQNPIGGFDYDDSVYTVTVTVTDNGTTITATPVITLPNASASDIVFENEYTAAPTELRLFGTKLLTGKVLQENEFRFIIERVTANAPMPYSNGGMNAVANYANGNIDFGVITFTKKGSYIYKIYEQDAGDARYDYDKSVYTLNVPVTDNSEGKLSASYALLKDDMPSSEIVFKNGYNPAPITYNIGANFGGKKVLQGRELADGEFEFELINAINGQKIGESVFNNGDGEIIFPTLTFHEIGTYHYKIQEVIGDEKGITYDPLVYHVIVGVEQINDVASALVGTLSIVRNELHKAEIITEEVGGVLEERTVYTNITDGGEIIFNNIYKADAMKLVLEGKKTLSGKELGDYRFKFNLYETALKEGKIVADGLVETVLNDADGKIAFSEIEIKEAGEYFYIVSEDSTQKEANIEYDNKEYVIKIVATDNLDGTLSANITYSTEKGEAEGIEFVNVYNEPKPEPKPEPEPQPEPVPETGDAKDLWMWLALAFISFTGLFTTGYLALRKEEN